MNEFHRIRNVLVTLALTALLTAPALSQPPPERRPGPGPRDGFPDEPGRPHSRAGDPLADPPRPPLPLTDGERADLLKFVEEHFPVVAEELQRIKEDPEKFDRRVRRIYPEMRRLMDLMRTDPERGALVIQERRIDMRIRLMVRRFHAAPDDAARAKLKVELRDQIEQSFDNRYKRREIELRDLEERVSDLRARLAESKAQRSKAIDDELNEYLEKRPPMGFRGPRDAQDPEKE